MRFLVPIFLFVILVAGCNLTAGPSLDLPQGWETDHEDKWWTTVVDTSRAFRDLETLQAMGVQLDPVIYDATTPLSAQGRVSEERIIRYVKQSLLPLFRNRPDLVDSLFNLYVTPKIKRGGPSEDPAGVVAKYKREGYRAIYRHFHEPRALMQLGIDIPVEIPDSLATVAAGRAVSFQVFLSEKGEPHAIERLSGVHPILDRVALLSTIQMRWQPAYLLKGRKSVPVSAWVRFRVRFPG